MSNILRNISIFSVFCIITCYFTLAMASQKTVTTKHSLIQIQPVKSKPRVISALVYDNQASQNWSKYYRIFDELKTIHEFQSGFSEYSINIAAQKALEHQDTGGSVKLYALNNEVSPITMQGSKRYHLLMQANRMLIQLKPNLSKKDIQKLVKRENWSIVYKNVSKDIIVVESDFLNHYDKSIKLDDRLPEGEELSSIYNAYLRKLVDVGLKIRSFPEVVYAYPDTEIDKDAYKNQTTYTPKIIGYEIPLNNLWSDEDDNSAEKLKLNSLVFEVVQEKKNVLHKLQDETFRGELHFTQPSLIEKKRRPSRFSNVFFGASSNDAEVIKNWDKTEDVWTKINDENVIE